MGEHGEVKRSTAIRHLVDMANEASDGLRMRVTATGWPLEEMWVTGDLLDTDGDLETGSVILVLDVPATDLPWLALHPAGEWVGERLRLGKRPMHWCYRPLQWPPWNARHRRVARIWTAVGGLDERTIDALRSGRDLEVIEPRDDQLRDQLVDERQVSYRHLHGIVDGYWEPGWRRRHGGGAAEDHLWRAAAALVEIDDALTGLATTEWAARSGPGQG